MKNSISLMRWLLPKAILLIANGCDQKETAKVNDFEQEQRWTDERTQIRESKWQKKLKTENT